MIDIVHVDVRLPKVPEVQRFLGDLLGRKILIPLTRVKFPLGPRDKYVAATYRDEQGRLAGVSALEVPLAVAFGAALASVTPDIAKTSLLSGRLSESLQENLYEVLNVMSRWFQPERETMVSIEKIWTQADLPAEARAVLQSGQHRFEFTVEVQGYYTGILLLATCPPPPDAPKA